VGVKVQSAWRELAGFGVSALGARVSGVCRRTSR